MKKGTIFVGGPSEEILLAQRVAQELEKDFHVIRWWRGFPAGDVTVDTLMRHARTVDGAVFICSSTDKVWRGTVTSMKPRDNVIFELGTFASHLGLRRCIAVKDEQSSLPTDLAGVTYLLHKNDEDDSTAERVHSHLKGAIVDGPPSYHAVPLMVGPTVLNQLWQRQLPNSWRERALYCGSEGARFWLDVVESGRYLENQREKLLELTIDVVEGIQARTYVPLGPGDGMAERRVLLEIRHPERNLDCIPVDISETLLMRAITKLSDEVSVPFGILSDFEERMSFIASQLPRRDQTLTLFSLLGMTLANLDSSESSFFDSLHAVMNVQDYLLVDVPLKNEQYKPDDDKRWTAAGYPAEYRRFLANGIARHTGEAVDDIVKDFESRIGFDRSDGLVEGSSVLLTVDRNRNDRIVGKIVRYDWASLIKVIESRGFEVGQNSQHFFSPDGTGYGVLLLKKRKN